MLIWLIFLFFVCFSVHSQRFILPAFFSIVTCLPYYVRLGPISLFAGICLFIFCYGVVSKYRIETFFVNKWIKYFLLYYVGSRVMIVPTNLPFKRCYTFNRYLSNFLFR